MAEPVVDKLQDILNTLGKIHQELKKEKPIQREGDTNVKLGSVGVIGSLLGKKGSAERAAEDIEKLKKAIKGFQMAQFVKLTNTLEKYDELSAKHSTRTKVSGWASTAQDIGKALLYIGIGIAGFVGTFALAKNALGISPGEVLLFIFGTFAILSASMIMLAGGEAVGDKLAGLITGKSKFGLAGFKNTKAKEGTATSAIQNAKDMGLALMYIAGGILSFAAAMTLSSVLLGVPILLVPFAVAAVVAVVGLTIVGLAELTAMGDRMREGKGKNKGKSKDAIQNAKDMGLAIMFIAGGILSFAIAIALVPLILKKTSVLAAVGEIALIIAGMVGIMALMTLVTPFVEAGIQTAKGIGIAVMVLAAGIVVVALVSKLLLEMFRGSKTVTDEHGKTHKEKGGPLGAIGNAAAALGVFGIFLAGLGALLWVLGLPIISGPIMLGSGAMIMMAFSLILTAIAIKKVASTMKEIGDMKHVSENIRIMINGVMSGVIAGVMGKDKAEGTGLSDIDISLKEVRQFRRVTQIIKMLAKVSNSLSQFAQGLKAFSKVGEIASLDYEFNEDGTIKKPKVGEGGKIHVKAVAQAIADTFGLFIKTLVTSTEGITRKQARSLKILGKALTGDKGIISGISQFATALTTYAQLGKTGQIALIEYDEEGNLITDPKKKQNKGVPIQDIVKNIVATFGKFVEYLSAEAPKFSTGGLFGRKMMKMTEALMGQSKGFLRREKPGILSAITQFSETLTTYAQYGEDGEFPITDPNDSSKVIGKKKTSDIAKSIVMGISNFVKEFEKQADTTNIEEDAKRVKDKIESVTKIVTQFNDLAQTQEGMEKLANSIGLLATNIGLLVTNMSTLNTDKLQGLATITAQHAVATKGVPIKQVEVQAAATSVGASQISQADWDKIGSIVGDKVAEKLAFLKTGNYTFEFHGENKGVLTKTN